MTTDGPTTFEVDLGNGVTAGNVQFLVTSFRYAGEDRAAVGRLRQSVHVGRSPGCLRDLDRQCGLCARQRPAAPAGPHDSRGPFAVPGRPASALSMVGALRLRCRIRTTPTFDDIEGLLRGFEENMTQLQFQQQLANELNIRRTITDATNDAFAPIVITSNDHGLRTGQSVLIRDIVGRSCRRSSMARCMPTVCSTSRRLTRTRSP